MSLRDALADATREASEKYAAFKSFRDALVDEHGAEKVASDNHLFSKLEERRRDYDTAATKAEDLQKRLLERLGAKVGGLASIAKGIPGLGEAFVARVAKALDGTSGGTMVPAFFDPRIRDLPQRQLFVRSVIPVRQADGDKVHYIRQTVTTHNAAPVAAGAVKPTSVYTLERVEETVRTIAHVTEALDRALLSDFDELIAFLNNQLRLGVLLSEENQILNGNGTAPNLRGILNTVGIGSQARGADDNATAIFKAINLVRANFFEPDAIVLHPNNWATIRTARDANGNYLTGDITDADQDGRDTLWGKPVITSPVIAANTGLVGAFAVGATVWDREEARITFTEAGLGDGAGTELFVRNQVRFRGEERIAFGVERPAAFSAVTGLN
jgi:HK97 family phage major capsid protein